MSPALISSQHPSQVLPNPTAFLPGGEARVVSLGCSGSVLTDSSSFSGKQRTGAWVPRSLLDTHRLQLSHSKPRSHGTQDACSVLLVGKLILRRGSLTSQILRKQMGNI